MVKRMSLGVFEKAAPQTSGMSWPHSRSQRLRYLEMDYWVEMAQVLDRGGFDFLFFADSYGYSTMDGAVSPAAVRSGSQFPSFDPMLLVPTLAAATERLGFVVSSPTGLDHPIQTARRFATLDHLTGGRIGWNIVTGSSQDAIAQVFGHDRMVEHDERYAMADEYVELAVRFWEECWRDGAVVRDRSTRVFADPERISRVDFAGRYYRSHGYLTVEPSPQRTPMLFQAGTSTAGKEFAARHAEAVFVQGKTRATTAKDVAEIRALAAARGRDAEAVRIYLTVSVTVAGTSREATELRGSIQDLQSEEIAASGFKSLTGIDLLALDRELPLSQIGDLAAFQMGRTNVERFWPEEGAGRPTVGEILAQLTSLTGGDFVAVGDPIEVADMLEQVMDETGVDGIMLPPLLDLADLHAFVDLVVPELHRRGRLEPAIGSTFRERMSGR